jgi:hypothetical protein
MSSTPGYLSRARGPLYNPPFAEFDTRARVAKTGVSDGPRGADLARLLAIKAVVLAKLGKKAESTTAWRMAAQAQADVAGFWKSHTLLQ